LNNRDLIREDVFRASLEVNLDELLPRDRFSHYWAREALKPQPPIDWIVERLFSAGSVSLVYGEGGSKKTFSMVDCAVCVALGKPWIDLMTKQRTVLLVDEESGPRRLARRLGDNMRGHFADESLPLAYITLAQFNFQDPREINILEEKIREIRANLIITDALADVMPGGDENTVKDVQPIFRNLRSIAEETESAIVLIHHSKKGGGYRGSTAMKAAVDLMLEVQSKSDSNTIKYKTEKVRDTEPFSFTAEAHFLEETFWLTSGEVGKKKSKLNKPQDYVIRFLADKGASLKIDIEENADIYSNNVVRQAIYKLKRQEMIKRTDSGNSGKKATYDLTDIGREYATESGYLIENISIEEADDNQ